MLVDHAEQNDTLDLTDLLSRFKLRFLLRIESDCFFLDLLLQLILGQTRSIFLCDLLDRNDRKQKMVEVVQIPVFAFIGLADRALYHIVYGVIDHLHDGITHVLTVENLTALTVDDLTLLVVDKVVLQQVAADTVVVALDLFLCLLDRRREHLVMDGLAFLHTE